MITNELISEIKSKINDNQKEAITGGVLQGVLVDMVNGLTTKGLTFLGILGPNDHAPSNEPTGGYYLSFQASTKETPYFNGVHLHRYSLLIWTQDETGRWKFKRVKYEDHRGPKRVVVGRALPIHFNQDTQNFTVHLSGDETRDTYAVCGKQVLRGEKHGRLGTYLGVHYGSGRKSNQSGQYAFIKFSKEDEGITLEQDSLTDFISDRIISSSFVAGLRACSEAYEINKNRISWRPKIQTRLTPMTRKVKDYTYRPKPDGEYAEKMWAVKNIPGFIIKDNSYICPGEYRRAKRYKKVVDSGGFFIRRAAGLSENYIKVYFQNTLY